MIKAVVFDLDDTLTPEMDFVRSGFKHVSIELSAVLKQPKLSIFNELLRLFDMKPTYVFNRLLDSCSIIYEDKLIQHLVEEYRSHTPEISFYSDVITCTSYLNSKKIKLGIISDGYLETQKSKVSALNAEMIFEHIILTDELGSEFWKPSPKAFHLMREKMNVNFSEMIYIGDNPTKDFYVSELLPIKTIRILRNGIYKNHSYYMNVRESVSINTLNELCEMIDTL